MSDLTSRIGLEENANVLKTQYDSFEKYNLVGMKLSMVGVVGGFVNYTVARFADFISQAQPESFFDVPQVMTYASLVVMGTGLYGLCQNQKKTFCSFKTIY